MSMDQFGARQHLWVCCRLVWLLHSAPGAATGRAAWEWGRAGKVPLLLPVWAAQKDVSLGGFNKVLSAGVFQLRQLNGEV